MIYLHPPPILRYYMVLIYLAIVPIFPGYYKFSAFIILNQNCFGNRPTAYLKLEETRKNAKYNNIGM